MKIDAKRARKNFKIYCLTLKNYLLFLKFSFKIIKILDLFKSLKQKLLDTQTIIVQLAKEFFKS